jgi:uncharacterized protein YceH (UPF0502 family)
MDESIPTLSAAEVRVLGTLIEKSVTTPDYYPLSLGALTNACNQLTNRDPVVSYEESEVARALESLREKRLATQFHGADSRVPKYKHALTEVILLTPGELALLCVLMLRGPQTHGELRSRTERLFTFTALADVEESLTALSLRRPNALVEKLPRQFGMKEARYTHLFSGQPGAATVSDSDPAEAIAPGASPPAATPVEDDRIAKLEEECEVLRREVDQLKRQFVELKRLWE